VERIIDFILQFLDNLPIIRGFVGALLVFFVPGFAWTLVFFHGRHLTIPERLILSIALSIATVTLSIIVANMLLGVKVTGINSIVIILIITVIPISWYYLKRIPNKLRSHLDKE